MVRISRKGVGERGLWFVWCFKNTLFLEYTVLKEREEFHAERFAEQEKIQRLNEIFSNLNVWLWLVEPMTLLIGLQISAPNKLLIEIRFILFLLMLHLSSFYLLFIFFSAAKSELHFEIPISFFLRACSSFAQQWVTTGVWIPNAFGERELIMKTSKWERKKMRLSLWERMSSIQGTFSWTLLRISSLADLFHAIVNTGSFGWYRLIHCTNARWSQRAIAVDSNHQMIGCVLQCKVAHAR